VPGYPPPLPPGRRVSLPERGDMWLLDTGGAGPPVVLLHGWTSTAALNWSPSLLRLSDEFRVMAPDHRGHGRGIRTRRFTLEDCADDLAALVDLLGCGPVVAVGYSMGGPIAQLFWHRHPEAVAGLVLCATAARFPGRTELAPAVTAVGLGLSFLLSAIPGGWRRQALTRLVEGRDDDPDRARWVLGEQQRSDPAALVQAAAALNAYDATGWIGTVDVPTSVIITSRDTTVPPARQWQLARTIPGAEHIAIPWGHRAAVEAKDQFVPALRAALRSVLARADAGGALRPS
jgi:3-oxoadipate enol-lactonase